LQTGVWHTWADYLANIDYQRRMAIVTLGPSVADPELIAVARYESMAHEDVAEIALVVQDSWQGRGLGAFLLREILRVGERTASSTSEAMSSPRTAACSAYFTGGLTFGISGGRAAW
jgi:GNAT superfamily N-acetyltransferase